jgi:hypothetical protein
MDMTRRQFLAFLTAGGIMTADELWLPGRKLISIPNRPIVTRAEIELLDKLRASYDGGLSFFKVPTRAVLANNLEPLLAGDISRVTIQHPVTHAWLDASQFGAGFVQVRTSEFGSL